MSNDNLQPLRDALEKHKNRMKEIGGCSNHYCTVYDPGGMRTNGACRCWENKMTAQRAMLASSSFLKEVEKFLVSNKQEAA